VIGSLSPSSQVTSTRSKQAKISYGGRMLFWSALEVLVREGSTIRNITRIKAQTLIDESLASAECPAKDAGPRAEPDGDAEE
jgi:hypothetical protein